MRVAPQIWISPFVEQSRFIIAGDYFNQRRYYEFKCSLIPSLNQAAEEK